MSSQCLAAKLSALLLGCALVPAGSFAQISFESQQVATNPYEFNVIAHGDFNNDGREDLVTDKYVPSSSGGMDVQQIYLSNGDGSYQTPVTLPTDENVTAIGDFNGDGNLDYASVFLGSVTVYLGNGDGTFQSPHTVTNSGTVHTVVAVDMNHDGKTDLVGFVHGIPDTLQIWLSNGDGTFSQGQTISMPNHPEAYNFSLITGDFDGDGNPDIAVVDGPGEDTTTVDVAYGDGAGHLGSLYHTTDPNQYFDESAFVADVNNDGRSDIIATPYASEYGTSIPGFTVFRGNSNRTLSYSTIATSECVYGAAVADFNGDGFNDLLYNSYSCIAAPYIYGTDMVVKLGQGSGSFGGELSLYKNSSGVTAMYAVRTSLGTRPDIAFSLQENTVYPLSPSSIDLLINSSEGDFAGCGPSGFAEGVTVCVPGATSPSPVMFSVGTAGPTPMRTAQVWVDGKKAAEQLTHAFSNYSFLDGLVPIAAGSHRIAVLGTGWDGTIQEKAFTLTVAGIACYAPTSPGVNLCQPASGTSVSSPVTIQAAANVSGTLSNMQVWIDGVQKYTETSSATLSTTLSVAAGTHRFAVLAINTAGKKWEQAVNATVK